MAKYRMEIHYKATITGSFPVTVDSDGKREARSEAEDRARDEIEQEFMNTTGLGEVVVGDCDVCVEDVTFKNCPDCRGRKYRIDTLEAGAGLLKVGPCPSCQQTPNTEETCKHVLALLQQLADEQAEEDDGEEAV